MKMWLLKWLWKDLCNSDLELPIGDQRVVVGPETLAIVNKSKHKTLKEIYK